MYGIVNLRLKAQNPSRSGGSRRRSGEELDRIYMIDMISKNKHPENPACLAEAPAKAG
jgi:hypothetical protein